MAIITNFYKGDTLNLKLKHPNNDDISGKDAIITFKKKKNDSDLLALMQYRFTLPTTADTQAGIHNFTLSSDQTKYIPSGVCYYDIRIVEDMGDDPDIVETIESERIQVLENVSDLLDGTWTPPITNGSLIVDYLNDYLGNEDWQVAKIDASGRATISTLNISNIPTSSSGLSSGDVWNDAGTLKIVT